MAMWDFTIDSEIQTELAHDLREKSDEYDEQVKNMYGKVNDLSQYWVGEDYDAFKSGTEGYSGALKDLSDGIRMYANHFDKISAGTEQLASEFIEIINNMAMSDNSTNQYAPSNPPSSVSTPSVGVLPDSLIPGFVAGNLFGVDSAQNAIQGSDDNSNSSSITSDSLNTGVGIINNHISDLEKVEEEIDNIYNSVNNGGDSSHISNATNGSETGNDSTSKQTVVEDGYFSSTWLGTQVSDGVDTPFYLTDDQSIYYQDGKIYYPDGHYEERSLRNYYDREKAWKEINGIVYKSELPVIVPEGYTLVDNFSSTWLGTQVSDGVDAPFYLTDDQSIYYQDGKIYYPDGHYEERSLRNYYDREKAWKEINKYVYESDCR